MAASGHPAAIGDALKDATLAALVAGVLALPMLGFELRDGEAGPVLHYRFALVPLAMAVVFAGRLALRALRPRRVTEVRAAAPEEVRRNRRPRRLAGWSLAAAALLLPFAGWAVETAADWTQWGWLSSFSNQDLIDKATLVLIYVMLGWGLNIVVGLAGLLDLGYVAFYAIGAYTYALLSHDLGLSFWACLPLSGGAAALFGILLGFPVLRLRGDYLAIVTLGFGEIVRVILLNWQDVTGGPNGIIDIPHPGLFGLVFQAAAGEGQRTFADALGLDFAPVQRVVFLYFVILALALVTNLFAMRIRALPIGRAWEALREDETASRSLGINPTTAKLSAFAIGAMFAGFAGSFFAARQGSIFPESFNFTESATILGIVVLGGMGSQLGIVFAALLFIGLPEWFRDLDLYRMLAFGAAMVLIMLWRPRGLMSVREPAIRLAR